MRWLLRASIVINVVFVLFFAHLVYQKDLSILGLDSIGGTSLVPQLHFEDVVGTEVKEDIVGGQQAPMEAPRGCSMCQVNASLCAEFGYVLRRGLSGFS